MGPLESGQVGRLLLAVGILVAVLGVILLAVGRLPVGRLPGDISGSRGGFSFYLPIGTSLVLSVVLTVLITLFLRR
jgi:hypothetical protein